MEKHIEDDLVTIYLDNPTDTTDNIVIAHENKCTHYKWVGFIICLLLIMIIVVIVTMIIYS